MSLQLCLYWIKCASIEVELENMYCVNAQNIETVNTFICVGNVQRTSISVIYLYTCHVCLLN